MLIHISTLITGYQPHDEYDMKPWEGAFLWVVTNSKIEQFRLYKLGRDDPISSSLLKTE